SLLVVGTLAYDTVETPSGRAEEVLGGAATYFSYAASFFGPVRLVGAVGEDFREEDKALLARRGVDLAGLEVRRGKSFRWSGRYAGDLNVAETLETRLNVLSGYAPRLPPAFRDSRFVFLANSPPSLQGGVLSQVRPGAFKVMDTMNLWLRTERAGVLSLLRQVDALVINDQEARMLAEEPTLIRAGRAILSMGPKLVVVKKGEHGAFLFHRDFFFAIPAYPVENVVDPTGAGDSFAGGFMGHLARAGSVDEGELKRAVLYGSVLASFNVEDFSLRRFQRIDGRDVEARYRDLLRFTAHP
ncbi:MAG: PfkB family carbohydrate kinase, partial [Planctomycetota bacterium]